MPPSLKTSNFRKTSPPEKSICCNYTFSRIYYYRSNSKASYTSDRKYWDPQLGNRQGDTKNNVKEQEVLMDRKNLKKNSTAFIMKDANSMGYKLWNFTFKLSDYQCLFIFGGTELLIFKRQFTLVITKKKGYVSFLLEWRLAQPFWTFSQQLLEAPQIFISFDQLILLDMYYKKLFRDAKKYFHLNVYTSLCEKLEAI
jgi:hypothetical protein